MFGSIDPTNLIFLIISILIALTLHEFMHAFVAFKLGDRTAFEGGRVSFNPLQHIDPIMTVALPIITILIFHVPFLAAKPVPFNPEYVKYDEFGAAMIAAAGPLTNLALAFLGAVLDNFVASGSMLNNFLNTFITLNVALMVFNLIPIPPLDGSRVVYAFAPEPVRRIFNQVEPFGLLIVISLVLLGGFGGVISHLNQLVLNLLP